MPSLLDEAKQSGTGGGGIFGKKIGKKLRDPLGIGGKGPKKPVKSAEQLATEIRTRSLLDKEIEEEETAFKLLRSKKLGRASFLGTAAGTRKASATKSKAPSMLQSSVGQATGDNR